MTLDTPADQPVPATASATPAAAAVPAADAPEPIGTSIARVIGGALLMIVTGAVCLVLFAYYVAGDFLPGGEDFDLFGDWPLYGAIFAFVAAATGFGFMRSGLKRRKAAAAAAPQAKADSQP